MRTLLHPARTSPVLQDAALLLARVAIGFILLAHGLQKFLDYTLDDTAASFTQMGIPVPAAAAVFAATVETVGGAALIIGLLTPVVAALNVLNLLGAFVVVHADKGVFVDGGGYETRARPDRGPRRRRAARRGPLQRRRAAQPPPHRLIRRAATAPAAPSTGTRRPR
ncbi:DoxX family protein [Clavibacter tessellarius]|uniref:DoxX family protein n=1 Tax=Clavibacter tessellarius TaxID=31965 RepID=UPI00324C126D